MRRPNRKVIEAKIRSYVKRRLRENPKIRYEKLVDGYIQENGMPITQEDITWRKRLLFNEWEQKRGNYSKK